MESGTEVQFSNIYSSSSPSAVVVFFFLGFFSLSGRTTNVFRSSSSSSLLVFSFSGLYHTGGWVISHGPPGRIAIVKWKAATTVPAGVYLISHECISQSESRPIGPRTAHRTREPGCAVRPLEDPLDSSFHHPRIEC